MAVSKIVMGVGMIVIAVVAFVVGLYASPLIFPTAKEYAAGFTYSPMPPPTGKNVTFDASPSKPEGKTILWYYWNFADGSPPVNTTDVTTTHVFALYGVYNVTLTTMDSEGLENTGWKLVTVIAEDSVWARVTETGKIIVGTEPGWPPYEYLNETGAIVGFEIELMEMIADELNLTVEWRNMGFDAIIPAVQAMDIDLGVSGFSVTIDRLEVVQFTMPHSITEGQVIMLQTRANQLGITQLTSLANLTQLGLKCGTQVGTTQEAELMQVAPGALVTYNDFLLALEDMKRGAIDCVYAETPITSNWILEAEQKAETPIVVIYKRPYFPVAFVAHKDAHTLVAKINGVLAEKLIATAELDELKQKWKC